jgi:hypothetical protein
MARSIRSTLDPTIPRNFKCVNHHDGTFTVSWNDHEGSHRTTCGDAESSAICRAVVQRIVAGGPFAF